MHAMGMYSQTIFTVCYNRLCMLGHVCGAFDSLPVSDVILMESSHQLYCHSVTRQSKHTSASKIALKVQHRKHHNAAAQLLFQEKLLFMTSTLAQNTSTITLTLTFFCHHWKRCPLMLSHTGTAAQTATHQPLCRHTLLVLILVITQLVPAFTEQINYFCMFENDLNQLLKLYFHILSFLFD